MKIEFRRLVPYLIILAAIIFHALTIRQGHSWGGDFSLYIAHAKNIIQGSPYAETGYIYNSHYPQLSPETYPPVFPLLLVPVYKFFGLNLYAMRVYILLFFLVFLIIFYQYSKDRLVFRLNLMGTLALVAYSPWIWDMKNRVISDLPFLLFLYAALVFLDKLNNIEKSNQKHGLLPILAGLTIYLAYGTRSVGLLLIPALIAKDLINFRTIKRSSIIAIMVFSAGYLMQSTFLHSDKTYGDTLMLLNFEIIQKNLHYYLYKIAGYWTNGAGKVPQTIMVAITMVFSVIGFGRMVKKQCSSAEFFLIIYFAVLVIWPAQARRFLIPILPLAILYFFVGVEIISRRLPLSYKHPFQIGIMTLVILFYVGDYLKKDFSNYSFGVEKKETRDMFNFIRDNTPQDSITIFRKPRILALYTNRKSSVYHEVENPEELWLYFKKIGATHLIVKPNSSNFVEKDYFLETLQYYRNALTQIYQNPNFEVYEIKTKP